MEHKDLTHQKTATCVSEFMQCRSLHSIATGGAVSLGTLDLLAGGNIEIEFRHFADLSRKFSRALMDRLD